MVVALTLHQIALLAVAQSSRVLHGERLLWAIAVFWPA
jgi:hypothetical protein